MKPYHENIIMPDRLLPVKAWIRKDEEYIFVHPHWHDEIEILYIMEGEAVQQINGKIFNAVKGDIICIAGNDVHSTYTIKGCYNEILVIQFCCDFIMPVDFLSPARQMLEVFTKNIELPPLLKADLGVGKDILENAISILYEFENRQAGFEMFIRARIFELIGIALRNFKSGKRSTETKYHIAKAREMLLKTFQLIDDNYNTQILLDNAAKTSNISTSHFCRQFKKATGMTFMDYLTFYRINKAEELLKTSRSITEIAGECGFENISSFIRSFKQYKNTTPSLYRKQLESKT